MDNETWQAVDLFAVLLDYPTAEMLSAARICIELLREPLPEAASLVEGFQSAMEKRTLEQMEELYTSTFDMQPVCYPYVGYQLFGESFKRGAFMAQLNGAYHSADYSAGKELPDHVSVILRFLGLDAANREDEFGRVLLCEGLMPALEKTVDAFGDQSENPYISVLTALHLVLAGTIEKELGHA